MRSWVCCAIDALNIFADIVTSGLDLQGQCAQSPAKIFLQRLRGSHAEGSPVYSLLSGEDKHEHTANCVHPPLLRQMVGGRLAQRLPGLYALKIHITNIGGAGGKLSVYARGKKGPSA